MRAIVIAAVAAASALALQGCAASDAESESHDTAVTSTDVAAPAMALSPTDGAMADTRTLGPDTPVSSPQAPAAGAVAIADGGMAVRPGSVPVPPAPGSPATAVPTQQSTVEAVVQRAVRAYETARTARGTFEQSLVNPQTGTRSTARGEFFRAQPDKFAFKFTEPRGDAIIADGAHVWVYLPSTNPGQVIRAPLSPNSAGSFDLGAMFFERPLERYAIADRGATTLDGRAVRAVQLTPRQRGGQFSTATVWLDGEGVLRQFHVVDGMGLERTVRITAYAPNATVDRSVFRFVPPEGVRVIDAAAMGQ